MYFVVIKEEFVFYEFILEFGKNVNVFKMVKSFFVRESFYWKINFGVLCIGGVFAMFGNIFGLVVFLKKGILYVIMIYCFLYWYIML